MKSWRECIIVFVLAVSAVGAYAADAPYIRFAKFRGDARGAVTLTFDDALPSQIEKAVPILDKYGLHATFFIHTDNVKTTWASTWDAWGPIARRGHEVGSHSQSHPLLSELTNPRRIRMEIEGSADIIEQHIAIRPISFAYPFSDVDDILRRKVLAVYFIDRDSCRMWGGAAFTAANGISNIEQAVECGEWFYSMMHGVGDISFKPISEKALSGIVKYLADHRDTIWTDTYANVGLYLRACRLVKMKFKDVREDAFMVKLNIPAGTPYGEHMIVPLTLMVSRSGHDAGFIKAYCGDLPIATSVSRDGKYFLMDVVPDGKWVQVYWGNR